MEPQAEACEDPDMQETPRKSGCITLFDEIEDGEHFDEDNELTGEMIHFPLAKSPPLVNARQVDEGSGNTRKRYESPAEEEECGTNDRQTRGHSRITNETNDARRNLRDLPSKSYKMDGNEDNGYDDSSDEYQQQSSQKSSDVETSLEVDETLNDCIPDQGMGGSQGRDQIGRKSNTKGSLLSIATKVRMVAHSLGKLLTTRPQHPTPTSLTPVKHAVKSNLHSGTNVHVPKKVRPRSIGDD